MAEFEAPVTHSVDQTRSLLATVAAYGSHTPRPCRRLICQCILVAGRACTALTSKFASERTVEDKAWRCTGAAG